MKYPFLLFDADNTLLDFTLSSRQAFAKLMEEEGIIFSDDLYQIYKTENAVVWKEFEEGKIDAMELRPKRFRLFLEATGHAGDPVQWNRRYLENLIDQAHLLQGAEALLKQLYGRHRMIIITNGLKEVQRPRFKKTRVEKYFDTIVVSDEIGFAKPQPEFFEYTFSQIGNPAKEQVLVIGDNLNSDIKGGETYGLSTCWYNPEKLSNGEAVKPKYEIQQLAELLKII